MLIAWGLHFEGVCEPPIDACGYLAGEEIHQHWNAQFVLLSLCVGTAGAFTSLAIMQHLQHTPDRGWYCAFVVIAGMSFGLNTIFCMHFVGMKALTLEGGITSGAAGVVAVRFNAGATLASGVLPWFLASLGVHLLARSQLDRGALFRPHGQTLRRMLAATTCIGSGVCLMHYLGMQSQGGFFAMRYSPRMICVSVLVALTVSAAGLIILFRFRNTLAVQFLSALVISIAVNGVHYCGMGSATYSVGQDDEAPNGFGLEGTTVALCALGADLALYVVCNHYGEVLRRALEEDRRRALDIKEKLEAERHKEDEQRRLVEQEALQQKLDEAVRSVHELGHPMAVVPAAHFLDLAMADVSKLHEGMRSTGHLRVLDNMDDVAAFKKDGAKIVFFSYECLAYHQAGPNQDQLSAMKAAIHELADTAEEKASWYVWLDCFSIPQRNWALKKAAINCIYTFACIPDFMVIVCPDSFHADTGGAANESSIKRRLWCRLEQLAYCCNHGTATMCLHKGLHLEELPAGWMDSVCCVYDADTTCCRIKHIRSSRCDREAAVLPLLALYSDVYSRFAELDPPDGKGEDCDEPLRLAWGLISKHKDAMFPRKFQYVSEGGTQERVLFGDLLERLQQHVHASGALSDRSEAATFFAVARYNSSCLYSPSGRRNGSESLSISMELLLDDENYAEDPSTSCSTPPPFN